jgi:L-lactate dehydrogenase complex protein LldF
MYLEGSKDTGHLNFASSLCGKCTEVCPVKIPLHRLLLLNRKKLVEEGKKVKFERTFFKYYKRYMLKRKKLDRVSSGWKNKAMGSVGKKVWGDRRDLPVFAKESFTSRWKNTHK